MWNNKTVNNNFNCITLHKNVITSIDGKFEVLQGCKTVDKNTFII